MKRNWKRILSLLLCMAMVFTMDTPAFAENNMSGNAAKAVQETAAPQNAAASEVQQTEAAGEVSDDTAEAVSDDTAETVSEEAVSENTASDDAAGADQTAAENVGTVSEDTTWQNKFVHTLSGGNIICTSYTGSEKEVEVPATATVSGVSYNTVLSEAVFGGKASITSISIDAGVQGEGNCSSMFNGCSGLTSLDVSKLDTTNVTDMKNMFYGCSGLTSLDVRNLSTDNVKDMTFMFYECSGLTSLDVSNFNTDKVTDTGGMFESCRSLTSLDVSSFNTDDVTDMGEMFNGCNSLTILNVSGLSTNKVTGMQSMFCGCGSLTSLDVGSFNTDSVTDMRDMFHGCSNLTRLNVSGFNTNSVTDMNNMFDGCSSLTSLDVSKFNTCSVDGMKYMFLGCSNLTSLDLSGFTILSGTDITNMLKGDCGLGTIKTPLTASEIALPGTYKDISGNTCTSISADTAAGRELTRVENAAADTWYRDYVYTLDKAAGTISCSQYKGSSEAVIVPATAVIDGVSYRTVINGGTEDDSLFSYNARIRSVKFEQGVKAGENCAYLFAGCINLKEIEMSGLDTASVNDMSYMFDECRSLKSLDLSSFDTKNVTDMSYMFLFCSGLTYLDLSGFVTGKVTDMSYMFSDCSGLTSLDLSSFDTGNVTDMSGMFQACSGLTYLNLSSFDTGNVTDMSGMFQACSGLTGLDLSSFDTYKVTGMYGMDDMFTDCRSLALLKTPEQTGTATANLPKKMYDGAGTVYSALSANCAKSLTLRTKGSVSATGIELDRTGMGILTGESQKLTASMVPAEATVKTVTWSSSDRSVAAVTDGTVTGIKAGTAVITAKAADGGFTATCTVTVVSKDKYAVFFDTQSGNDIAAVSYEPGEAFRLPAAPTRAGYTFIGWFTAENGRGTQYTAGTLITANVTLYAYWAAEGVGDTRSDLSTATVAAIRAQTYDGFEKKPVLTVKYGRTKLEEGVDYAVSYKDSVSAGTAAATVTGMGNYKGTVKGTFIINRKNMTSSGFEVMAQDMVLSGDTADSPVTVYDRTRGVSLNEGTDYTVEYSNDKKAGTAKAAIKGAGNYKGKLSRTYKVFSNGSILIGTVTLDQTSCSYDGSAKTPGVTVTDQTGAAVDKKDYSVSYRNNRNAGLASVTVKGKKNYKGSATAYFEIRGSEKTLTIADIAGRTYTGSQIKPGVTVKYTNDKGKAATLSPKYYTVTYSDNVEAGTARVTVTGRGNCSGTASSTFTINKKDISRGIVMKGFRGSLKATGSAVSQNITLYYGKHRMDEDRDYTVTYSDNTAAGKATMEINAAGGSSFTGKITRTFRIR